MPGMRVHAMSITPFTAAGPIDWSLFRAHLRFMAAADLGVYVASQGSGEGDLLSVVEKAELFQTAADELGSTREVVAAGIGLAGSTRDAVELVRRASAAGVRAVQLLGPRPGPLPPRPAEITMYLRALIDAAECDVHLSSNAVLTGYALPFDLVETLVAADERVRVLNVTDRDRDAMLAYAARAVETFGARVEVRVGMTSEVVRAHEVGAQGLLCFEPNVAPQLTVDACASLDVARLLHLNAALARGGNPRSLKAALSVLGRNGGALRPPYLPLPPDEVDALAAELRGLGLA